MKFWRTFLFTLVCGILVTAPVCFAADRDPLVPCGRTSNVSGACTICDLVKGIHGIIKFIVEIIAITGVVVIVIAGIFYMVSAGNTAMTSLAKSALKNTIIGVVIVLTGFVMITFIINNVFQNSSATLKVSDGGLKNMASNAWTFECKQTGS